MADRKPRDFQPLPYYRWYWRDYRASRSVQRMSYVLRGLYRELLDECWAKGSLPKAAADLAEICGCPVAVMERAWPTLSRQFVLRDGRYINERIENERTETDKTRTAASLAGKKSARSRRAKRGSTDDQRSSTVVERSSTSSSNSNSKSSSSALAGVEPARAAEGQPTPIGDVVSMDNWREKLAK